VSPRAGLDKKLLVFPAEYVTDSLLKVNVIFSLYSYLHFGSKDLLVGSVQNTLTVTTVASLPGKMRYEK
jgi:hypothetical protein